MSRIRTAVRRAGEFVGLLAIIIGAGLAGELLNRSLTPPWSQAVTGVVLALATLLGVWWVLSVSQDGSRHTTTAGLGGGLGAVATMTVLQADWVAAIGASIGAAIGIALALAWSRQSAIAEIVTR